MGSSDGGFVFTDKDNRASNLLWAATSAVGSGICFIVLAIIAVAMIHPVSKHHLDRVSFRVVIYALAANMIFGIASTITGLQTTSGFSCGFFMWILMLTLEISTFLLFSIALNLQLVLVHGINGQMMEKYYIAGSFIAALALTVPPYASKQYGWDPINEACWYSSSQLRTRLKWQVGTQTLWGVLCAAGEIVCFFTVLAYMLRHQVLHGKVVQGTSRSRAASFSTSGTPNKTVNHAKTYQSVIVRISLYPLVSLIINSVTTASDLYASTSDGVKTVTAYRILLLNDFCYGGRPIVYALLAATDPSLIRSLKALWRHIHGQKDDTTDDSTGPGTNTHGTASHVQVTVHIELNEVRQLDDGTTAVATSPVVKTFDKSVSEDEVPGIKFNEGAYAESNDDLSSRAARLETLRRQHVGRAMEMRQEALERKQDRKDFKKQI